MAWTGAATVTAVGKCTARITGLSLGASATGTIGYVGSGANVLLPSTMESATSGSLTLADLVRVEFVHTEPGAGNESRHIHVDKTVGPPFLITFTNDQNQATSTLEIYVTYLHSLTR